MEVEQPVGSDRCLHRDACELVPERHRARPRDQHSRRHAILQARERVRGQRLEQPQLRLRRHDRNGLEERPSIGVEPRGAREHGVPDGRRDVLRPRRQHLADEERVTGGPCVEVGRVHRARLRELRDGRPRQPGDAQPVDPGCGGQLPQHEAEWVSAVQLVVPVAGDDQRRHTPHPPRQQAQHVERGLVRPVKILQHHRAHPRPAQLGEQRGGDLVRLRAARHELFQVPADGLPYLEERAERTRREHRVACAPEDPRSLLVAELLQE